MYFVNESAVNLERIVYQNNRKDYLRLDLNENPGGLPEEFISDVLSEITPGFISQYPETYDFTEALAKFLNVTSNNICLVNGSSEGIRHIIEAFTSINGRIVGVSPSYAMYEVYAKMYDRNFVPIKYTDDLQMPVERIIEQLTPDTQLLILLNPNNPIGNAYTEDEFEQILKRSIENEITILIDEAYMYFYNNTFIDTALKNAHVFVTRTFSKLFSLGGLRLGYIVGQEKDVKVIQNLCTPHNTNAVAMLFAQRIIEKEGLLDSIISKQLDGKEYLIADLRANGYEVNAQEGNFIFIKPQYKDADELVVLLREKERILVKAYDKVGCLGKCLRVTTGERKYMDQFLTALYSLDKVNFFSM